MKLEECKTFWGQAFASKLHDKLTMLMVLMVLNKCMVSTVQSSLFSESDLCNAAFACQSIFSVHGQFQSVPGQLAFIHPLQPRL